MKFIGDSLAWHDEDGEVDFFKTALFYTLAATSILSAFAPRSEKIGDELKLKDGEKPRVEIVENAKAQELANNKGKLFVVPGKDGDEVYAVVSVGKHVNKNTKNYIEALKGGREQKQ